MNTIDTAEQPEPAQRDAHPQTSTTSRIAAVREVSIQGPTTAEPYFYYDPRPDLFSDAASDRESDGHRTESKNSALHGDRAKSPNERPPGDAISEQAIRPSGTDARGKRDPDSPFHKTAAPELEKSAGAAAIAIDAEFVSNLDSRMAKSDLKELGWRDRHDLDDVMSDLERLSAVSWKQAANLWDKYRPDDPDKPIFIDGDDKDPVPPQHLTAGAGNRPARSTEVGEALDGANSPGTHDAGAKTIVPKSLTKRYLVAENKFYFRDDPNLLAFEDKGKRLSTEHNDPMVARSMVELAHAKNWNSIRVKGTDEFKREVWLSASFRGIEVEGYQPRDIDIARLAELRGEFKPKQQNSIEQGVEREKADPRPRGSIAAAPVSPTLPNSTAADRQEAYRNLTTQQRVAVDTLRAILTERGDSAKAIEMAADLASERFQQQRVYVGRLLAHGHAPYENKPDEKMNYFVSLKTINGERTIWGVDLERAVNAGGIQTGDDLALVYRGRKRVKVLTNERDEAGKTTGKQINTEVNRNTWEMGKLDKMRDEARTRAQDAAQYAERNQPVVPIYDIPVSRRSKAVEPSKARSPDQPMSR